MNEGIIMKLFTSNIKNVWVDNITSNSDIHFLQKIIDSLSSNKFDAVVGFGGDCALDEASVDFKLIKNMLTNSWNYESTQKI